METNLLFRLSGELRNYIYAMVLQDHNKSRQYRGLLFIERRKRAGHWQYRLQPQRPPLAATSSQIRREVLSIFFGREVYEIVLQALGDPGLDGLMRWSRIARSSL